MVSVYSQKNQEKMKSGKKSEICRLLAARLLPVVMKRVTLPAGALLT
ncbi:hypothetical protein HMPREF0208_02945 [Citrobacter koseri]|uniref:Uncharacterized protein n=1 Tax=Citrobacter koseri (strain ATCC BAA-895 / CDC 4225-83 / SGSC4696) TaxID=290338 RepID=A8AH02_CITK8|nr:hypothetical protein CKO_01633 [Citrobacter koseri ATCC BAA-895]KWZ97203.1 hypothetical protein HMPREF3207_04619 [Citrobacter koseri]KWZ99618.1 hypothetical protein HMPREF3220_02040 [Citrobacter koseri]KXB42723.1 hypothetical protein HMPREF0208_02945 [Citrobacter koseri]